MLRLASILAAALLVSGAAVAQTQKVPRGQGVCSTGYEKSLKDGSLMRTSKANMKAVDTNNDGKISKAEFDAACAKKLFKDQASSG